jgi:hypothetical protein
VFFTNEEPPYFQTEQMGSLVYARACRARGDAIVAALSIESVGVYSDAKKSQHYPWPFSWFYPSEGNFLAFIGDPPSRELVRRATVAFRRRAALASEAAVLSRRPSTAWAGQTLGVLAGGLSCRHGHRHGGLSEHELPQADGHTEKLDYDRLARGVRGLEDVVTELAGAP